MNSDSLIRGFAKMGAELTVNLHQGPLSWRDTRAYTLDIVENRKAEKFQLDISVPNAQDVEFSILNVNPNIRHLLLMVRRPNLTNPHYVSKDKILCGHDERHWFASELPGTSGLVNVIQAMEALKPSNVVASQNQRKVRRKNWHKRKNAGFVRQGEWFFLPRPDYTPPNEMMLFKNEPLRRPGGGKPHVIEWVYRFGGDTVYVCPQVPEGVLEIQFKNFLKKTPGSARYPWRTMRRNPRLFAKGKVRHPDHQTIVLPFWYEVQINQEATRSGHVVFFD